MRNRALWITPLLVLVAVTVFATQRGVIPVNDGITINDDPAIPAGVYGNSVTQQTAAAAVPTTAVSSFTVIWPASLGSVEGATNGTLSVPTVATNSVVHTGTMVAIAVLVPGGLTNTIYGFTNAVATCVTSVVVQTSAITFTPQTTSVLTNMTGDVTNSFAAYTTTNQAYSAVTLANSLRTILTNFGIAK